jgi:hypothetical protein
LFFEIFYKTERLAEIVLDGITREMDYMLAVLPWPQGPGIILIRLARESLSQEWDGMQARIIPGITVLMCFCERFLESPKGWNTGFHSCIVRRSGHIDAVCKQRKGILPSL